MEIMFNCSNLSCNNLYKKLESMVAKVGRKHMKVVKIFQDVMFYGTGVVKFTIEVGANDFLFKQDNVYSVDTG